MKEEIITTLEAWKNEKEEKRGFFLILAERENEDTANVQARISGDRHLIKDAFSAIFKEDKTVKEIVRNTLFDSLLPSF